MIEANSNEFTYSKEDFETALLLENEFKKQ